MILERTIRGSAARPRLVLAAALGLIALAAWSVRTLPLEVLPPRAPVRIMVQTEAPGFVAEQVEQLVTRPVEDALGGAPGVASMRSQSVPGLSMITLDLARGAEPAGTRQGVAERLSRAAGALPSGVRPPLMAPPTSAEGPLLKLGFTSRRLDPMALRDVVQWTVRPRLLAAPGVANVAVYGGQTRRVEVRARPGDLSDSDLGFLDVIQAVRRATSATAAGFVDTPEQRVMIDPRGQPATTADVEAGQIQVPGNAPTRIGDVADVASAPAPSTGDALVMGRPGVLVEVSAAYGASTVQTDRGVQKALDVLRPALQAQGVEVADQLDRPAAALASSTRALEHDLMLAAVLIALALVLGLGDIRAALACLLALPLPLLAALVGLKALGQSLNAMTIGGLFVALGVIIDDAVIDVESVVSRLREPEAAAQSASAAVTAALVEVRTPVVYATLLIDVAIAPLLFATGPLGALLQPLALSILLASLASILNAAVVTPALCAVLIPRLRPEHERHPWRRARARYAVWVRRICARPGIALAALGLAILATAALLAAMPRPPLPALHDGHLQVRITGPDAASPLAMRAIGARLQGALAGGSGVRTLAQRIGRDPTDFSAAALNEAQIDLGLDPKLDPGAQDRAAAAVARTLSAYPDVRGRVAPRLGLGAAPGEAATPFAVSLYGEDLDQLDAAAAIVASVLQRTPGSGEVVAPAGARSPAVRIDLDFRRLALYGLSAADVLDTIQAAVAGAAVAKVYQNGRAIDLVVTGPESLRRDPEAIGRLLLRSSSGVSVPLRLVANIYLTESRTLISHEAGQRSATVTASPSDPTRFLERAKAAVARRPLPAGAYLAYDLPEARAAADRAELRKLCLVAALAAVGLLVLALRDGRMVLLVLASTGFALLGGAAAAWLAGGMSIGAVAGLLALFGLSARNAMLLVTRPHRLAHRELGWSTETVALAASGRARAILLTTSLLIVSVLPLLFTAREAGAEVLRPLAVVLIGGLVAGALMTLLFLPALVHAYLRPAVPAET